MMNFLREAPVPFIIVLIALMAFAYLGIAYVIADTGFPGGINPAIGNLIYAGMAFILGMAGWVLVWRRNGDDAIPDQIENGREEAFWGYLIVILFWGTGLWFLFQWLR